MISIEEFKKSAKINPLENLVTWHDHGREISMHINVGWQMDEQVLNTVYDEFYVKPAERREAEKAKEEEEVRKAMYHPSVDKSIGEWSRDDYLRDEFIGEMMRGEC